MEMERSGMNKTSDEVITRDLVLHHRVGKVKRAIQSLADLFDSDIRLRVVCVEGRASIAATSKSGVPKELQELGVVEW